MTRQIIHVPPCGTKVWVGYGIYSGGCYKREVLEGLKLGLLANGSRGFSPPICLILLLPHHPCVMEVEQLLGAPYTVAVPLGVHAVASSLSLCVGRSTIGCVAS